MITSFNVKRYTGNLPLTFILIGINVFVFILQLLLGDGFNNAFIFNPELATSEIYRFVTSTFLHGGFGHLFFNMFALFIFGIFLESRLKPGSFLAVYFIAGIVGNLGYLATGNPISALGASGAVYGVMGAVAAIAPKERIYMMLSPVPIPMFVGIIFYAFFDIIGFVGGGSGIAHSAHLSGLGIGLLVGLWLKYKYRGNVRRLNPINLSYNY